MKTVVLCAGGTGGHFFPAKALASDLLSRGYIVHFFCDERGQKYKNQLPGQVIFHVVPCGTMGKGLKGKVSGMSKLGLGLVKSLQLLLKIKPSAVIGFGGYPSYPGMYIAQMLKIPTIVHEQNAVMGKANMALSKKATTIAVSMPLVKEVADSKKVLLTGNPVRQEIADLYTQPYSPSDKNDAFYLYVVGGSLGAKSFSDVVPMALKSLSKELRSRLFVFQQTKEEDIPAIRALYKQNGIDANVRSFFEDAHEKLRQSHLVISRGGASAVAELTTAGRPAIYVPYPHHVDQQQKHNVSHVVAAKGGWLMEEGDSFNAEDLAKKIAELMVSPELLFNTAEAARQCATPDAARKLGNIVSVAVQGWKSVEEQQSTSGEPSI
ncbi:MAG: undecaprenyldiphospho-muramoylpentapeptide beta-N-acetylglucosaminyltransferase [Micavibrio sp.]|nr:undecaprenyldiphospho-muramoylpentapeptide beta-N-acetylglucosaminyltransferase [Micavibrio sp.]|tara:strand:- start:2209 stop:3345 length:1137 start_codon:yes stop_codon:yes gene_type:complete